MEPWIQMVVTIICAVFSSSGVWALLQRRYDKKDAKTRMILGLGHDRIMQTGAFYIERGWITRDEYENLNDYLYDPYKEMGGNGSAERIMEEIKKLPIKTLNTMPVPRMEVFQEDRR